MNFFNKIYHLFYISLFLYNVICQNAELTPAQTENTEQNATKENEQLSTQSTNKVLPQDQVIYYETNFLISNFENLESKKAKTCTTIDDCPVYATSCTQSCESGYNSKGVYETKCTSFSICNFEFKCRANYPCLIKFNNTLEYDNLKMRYEKINLNRTSEVVFFNEEFILGNQVGLDMNSCYLDTNNGNKTYECSSNPCKSNDDCYSRKCDSVKGRCIRNDKVKEYYCKPFGETVDCKLDLQQACSADKDCASGVCDYIGICLTDYDESNKKIYKTEVVYFIILISLIFATIFIILLCSCYCSRKIKKGSSGRKNRRLED